MAVHDRTDHDGALEDVLDGVEKGLSRLPVDDAYRPGLLLVRRGLLQGLGRDPYSPLALAVVRLEMIPAATISELDDARRRKASHREDES